MVLLSGVHHFVTLSFLLDFFKDTAGIIIQQPISLSSSPIHLEKSSTLPNSLRPTCSQSLSHSLNFQHIASLLLPNHFLFVPFPNWTKQKDFIYYTTIRPIKFYQMQLPILPAFIRTAAGWLGVWLSLAVRQSGGVWLLPKKPVCPSWLLL